MTTTESSPTKLPEREYRIPGEGLVNRAVAVVGAMLLALIASAAVVVGTVRIGTTIDAPGTLEPLMVVVARAAELGTITRVAVATGQSIHANDLLISLDTTPILGTRRELETQIRVALLDSVRAATLRPIDLQTALARREQAAASVSRARTTLLATLIENRRNPDIDSALTARDGRIHVVIDAAKADVHQADIELRVSALAYDRLVADSSGIRRDALAARQVVDQLKATRRRLASASIRSQIDGIVLTDHLEALVGRTVREGEALLEIASTTGWHAELQVSEAEIHRVRLGQPVSLELRAHDRYDRPALVGTVIAVGEEPAGTQLPGDPQSIPTQAPVYRVVVALRLPDSLFLFRRGFTLDARIQLGHERLSNVLLSRFFGSKAGSQ